MSVTAEQVMMAMEQWCPAFLACHWDNPGLQVGSRGQAVRRILVALDATAEVIAEAKALQADMLITHHPLIFGGINNLCLEGYPQKLAVDLLQAGICHFAAHTNLDIVAGGVNDALAAKLGLTNISSLPAEGELDGLGRIGDLPQSCSFAQLEHLVKEKLGVTYLKVAPIEREMKRVAVCGGSGMDLLVAAKKAGADCLISAESKHHQAMVARHLGIGVIDAGHFDTEKVIVPVIAEYLRRQFPGVAVSESKTEQNNWLIR